MKFYDDCLSLVPGPTEVSDQVLQEYTRHWGSSDIEPEYVEMYEEVGRDMCAALHAAPETTCVIMTGEAMVVLWGAVKSLVQAGDRVVCVGGGLFGEGFADIAKATGAAVELVNFPWDRPFDPDTVRQVCARVRPHLITAVHCDTPSGMLQPIHLLGPIARECGSLLLVDVVASAFTMPLRLAEWGVDVALLGTQKALGALPDLGLALVAPRAWTRIAEVRYQGYDALLPFRAPSTGTFPYTPCWPALAALRAALAALRDEGEAAWTARHRAAAEEAQRLLQDELGLSLVVREPSARAPGATAAWLPADVRWPALDDALRQRRVRLGGSYGPLEGRVVRLGHMGRQADVERVRRAVAALRDALHSVGWRRPSSD